jgi:Tol biopolymer transport system component/predicted Ser/Thr protein kinase
MKPGDKLGPYEILSPLGAGGMGEVWKARDTRLNREVAIKFSNEKFTDRFEREAKSIAALNHPNICQLYDVGENYLVMELIEGESLQSPLPIKTALDYARQIADALEAAHEKGIIHRDLKPANIKVTEAGAVKVLDFGIAKWTASPGGDPENSPTSTMATLAGAVLGTAAYMAPEQARGKAVDKRADIWAFGVILYEMIAGKRPFAGETVSDVVAAALAREPDFEIIPEPPRSIIEKCLRKDPRLRWRDIGDVRMALDEKPAIAPATPRRNLFAIALAVALVAAITAGFFGWWRSIRANDQPLRPLVRLDVDLGPDVSLGNETPVLSRDGTRIAYPSRGRIYVRRFDQAEPVELAGAQGGAHPFFSPDGQWVAFFTAGKLRKVSVDGGDPVDLCPLGGNVFGTGSWDENGIVAENSLAGLFRVPADGGAASRLTVTDQHHGEFHHAYPQILPGGKSVLFTVVPQDARLDRANIEVVSIADHQRKTILTGAWFARYTPTGHLIFLKLGTLFAVPFDLDRLEPHGTPTAVLSGVVYFSSNSTTAFEFSSAPPQSGVALYRAGGGPADGTVQSIEASGRMQPVFAKPDAYQHPRFSPDGKRLALIVQSNVYVFDTARETMTRLTFNDEASHEPTWTPDAQYIVFRRPAGGIGWVRTDGGGASQILTQSANSQFPQSFTPDGKTLVYSEFAAGGFDLFTVPIRSDPQGLHAGAPEVFLNSPFNERNATFSRDGKWIAYFSDESGAYECYVRSFPDRGAKWQISTQGCFYPVFARTSNEISYRTPDGRLMLVSYTVNNGTFAAAKPRPWSGVQIAYGASDSHNYELAPDGKRVISVVPAKPQDAGGNHIVLLLNFFDELRRRAPVSK